MTIASDASVTCPTCDGSGTVPTFAALRERLGWTERECAERLGVRVETVSRWTRGRFKPKPLYIEKMEELVRTKERRDAKKEASADGQES